jgi:hypothetical protein
MTPTSDSPEWWRQARAYLKAKVTDDHGATLSLSRDDSPILRDLENGLLVAYVVDEGERFTFVQHRHLGQATSDDLHDAALANLYDLARERLRLQPYGSVFGVFVDGNFEASVLLLDTLWDRALTQYVQGEFVVAVPSRDVLAFGDSGSARAIGELRAIVDRVYKPEANHLLVRALYRRRAGKWVIHDA